MSEPVTPRDVLPDGDETAQLDGREVRKGTVAAFVANARALERMPPDDPARPATVVSLRELLPGLRAVGVLDVFVPRSRVVAAALGAD